MSSWWKDEAKKYGVGFEQHDDRYARTAEWLDVVENLWERDHFSFEGKYYRVEDAVLQPKPLTKPRPAIYAGGESEAAKDLIARKCDAYVMHGDPPDVIGRAHRRHAPAAREARPAADDLRRGGLLRGARHGGGGAAPRWRASPT